MQTCLKTAKFDAGVFKDHYQAALRELIATKLKSKGKTVSTKDEPAESRPSGSNVVDLMAALKSSLEGSGGSKAASAKKTAAKKPSTKTAPRKKAS